MPTGLDCLRAPARLHGFEDVPAEGVPTALHGTLYRVGPGRFEDSRGPFGHWFDGEGLIAALRLRNGRVSLACRMVRPDGHDRPCYPDRGRLGRAPRGLLRRLGAFAEPSAYVNVANTALMDWQDRLFALFEAGLPTEIDPDTLETLGERDFGVVTRSLGAHPQPHRPTGDLVNQGFVPPPRPAIDYYRLPRSGPARRLARVPVSNRFPAHDLAVTDRHVVTVLSPLVIDMPRVISGRPIADCLRWRPELGTEVVLTRLDGGQSMRRRAAPVFYSHTANAYEAGEEVVVHGIAAEDASLADWTGRVRRGCESLGPRPSPGRLTELRVEIATGQTRIARLAETPMEFPTVDPRWAGRRHSVVFGTGYAQDARAYDDLSDAILRVDLASGHVEKLAFGRGHAVSEPVFVPRGPAEGDGWLLCLNYDADADRSYLAVIGSGAGAGAAVGAGAGLGLVCRVTLGQALPLSLHGLWRPANP